MAVKDMTIMKQSWIITSYRSKVLIAASLVLLITVLVYLPSLQNDFVDWDDPAYVYENQYIHTIDLTSVKWMFTGFYFGNWHPLTWFSHALDYSVWGLVPMGHHLTSIIIHGLNACLVVLFVVRLILIARPENKGLPIIAAVVTGLLFGLHPIHVESVAWVSERKDLLCAFFFLLSMLSYLKYTSLKQESISTKGHYILSILFFSLALMSKPMAITLPVVLIILDIYPLERLSLKRAFSKDLRVVIEKLPFFGLTLVSSAITILAQQSAGAIMPSESLPFAARIMTAFKSIMFYLYKMVWPMRLIPLYPHPVEISFLSPEYSGAFILIVSVTVACVLMRKKHKVFSALWAYYIVTLLPVLGIIQVGLQAAADRYTYMPSLGPFILIGLGAGLIYERTFSDDGSLSSLRRYLPVAAIFVICLLSVLTIKQIKIWKNSLSLWDHELAFYSLPLAYNGRGNGYLMLERYNEAISDYNKAIELDPEYLKPYTNRGTAYFMLGEYREAVEDYSRVIKLAPGNAMLYYNRGITYLRLKEYWEAMANFNKAIELDSGYAMAYYYRGLCYNTIGDNNKANKDFQAAARLGDNKAQKYLESMGMEY